MKGAIIATNTLWDTFGQARFIRQVNVHGKFRFRSTELCGVCLRTQTCTQSMYLPLGSVPSWSFGGSGLFSMAIVPYSLHSEVAERPVACELEALCAGRSLWVGQVLGRWSGCTGSPIVWCERFRSVSTVELCRRRLFWHRTVVHNKGLTASSNC